MVAKLVLDQLEKTGGALTALTLPVANATASQYLQNNGSGVMSWSTVTAGGVTNIKHTATATVTLVEADVSGKSSLVVSVDPSGGNMIVNLPALGTTGLSSCIITVVSRADATSTFSLIVKDSAGTEVWTGYQKNDFITLCESNSVWLVLDHKETYFASRWLTANLTVGGSTTAHLTGFTEISDIGNMWDVATDRVVVPTGMSGFFDINVMSAADTTYPGTGPAYKISGVWKGLWNWGGTDGAQYNIQTGAIVGREIVTTAQYFEAWCWNKDTATKVMAGGEAGKTHFNVTFTRTY
jgi:hypothetical protein